ncbi:uncharacterized protein BDW47DRAFT_78296 [Aspergillus candidus]|uniref:Uncharacterized protein n=1 Tax=Aspergillus candidus TaxID=41067 RepID=A0A2I2F161_ASPCN|nr:hypothetical protein BDW47DRAFT_78296 [Aspergillus candidus]PLB34372.1 hypothetical protein BDW47DRAFT_78296 [Aspergillus candidus]
MTSKMVSRIILLLTLLVGLVLSSNTTDTIETIDTTEFFELTARDDGTDLDVRRDKSVRPTKPKPPGFDSYLWSSIATFTDDLTDGNLVQIADDAHKRMRDHWKTERIDITKQPTVMTALKVGRSVYLASSTKGNPPVVYERRRGQDGKGDVKKAVPDELANALTACLNSRGSKEPQHQNEAQCGEVMAIFAWIKLNPGQKISDQKAVIIAWEYKEDPQSKKVTANGIKPPCNSRDFWGCKSLLPKLKIREVKKGTKGEPYSKPTEIRQQELLGKCGLTCTGTQDSRGTTREAIMKHVDDMCDRMSKDNRGKRFKGFSEEYKNAGGTTVNTLKISLEEGADQGIASKAECKKNFQKTIDECDTNTRTQKKGGRIGDGRLIYSWSTHADESKVKCQEHDEDNNTHQTRDYFLKNIKEYCKDGLKLKAQDQQGENPDQATVMNSVNLLVRYPESQSGCHTGKDHEVSAEDCERSFRIIVDECDTNTREEKWGGSRIYDTNDGCFDYSVTGWKGEESHHGLPPSR